MNDDEAAAITKAVGRELQLARESRGWSRPELSKRMSRELSVNTYACYEQGVRTTSIPVLVEMCEALGVAAPELLALALQRANVDPRTNGIRVDLRRILADQRDQLRMLRRWARFRLGVSMDDSGVVPLKWGFVEDMAAFMGMPEMDLLGYLREFVPSAAPRR